MNTLVSLLILLVMSACQVKTDGASSGVISASSIYTTTISGTSNILADGVATSSISINVKKEGLALAGEVPTFSVTGSANTISACSATDANGNSTCTLKSTKAEIKSIKVLKPTVSLQSPVTFLAGSPSASTTTIVASGPTVANGTAAASIQITVKDAFSNLVAGVTPTFSATDTGSTNSYTACSVSNSSGVSSCSLKSTKAEIKLLSILTPVAKTSGTAIFMGGAPVAANSGISGTSPVYADGSASSAITILLMDVYNNPSTGYLPTFLATDTGSTNVYNACSISDISGISSCTVKSLTAESKTLSISSPISKTGGTVSFITNGPSALNSSITGTGSVIANGVAISTVTITLKDSANVPVSGQVPTFSATNTGAANAYGLCSATNSLGVSTCTLKSTKAETKTLSIATPVVKADGTVVFTPGSPSSVTTTINGTTPVVANGISSSIVSITILDDFSNPISGVSPIFNATDSGATNIYGACSVSNANGLSLCTLASTTTEVKTLQLTSPVAVTGNAVTFTANSAVAANSTITGTSPIVADGVATSTVTITLRDTFNNPVSGETPSFSATDAGTTNIYGLCSATNAFGVSTCALSSLKAETKTLSIATPVVKADGNVIFIADVAVAVNSTITGTSSVVANGVATSTITVTLKDVNNNFVSGITPTFSATDTGVNNSYGLCSVTNLSGVSTCTLSSTTAETKTLSLLTPVSKSDGTVVFTSAAAVAANSSITGTTPVIADGVATSTVTITLKDVSNNPVSGQTPTFSATDSGTKNTYGTCSATDASGISTCTLSSLAAETKILSIETPVIKAGTSVVFTAGTAVAANSTITGTSLIVADGVASSTITVTLKDLNNNFVSGVTPTFSATDTGTNNTYSACSVTNASGVSTCTLSSTKAESKTLSIATPFVKADGIVVFIPGSPSATTSTVVGTTPVNADGVSTSAISITFLDDFSNPISGISPVFNATDSGSSNSYGACTASNTSGLSVCTLASTTAEIKTLQLTSPIAVTGNAVTFTSTSAVAANSTITGTSPVVANGTSSSSVTITLKDAFNNPVAGQTPTFSATDTGTNNAYTACSVTNAAGVSTCTLTSLTAEVKTLAIATPVIKADGTVVFSAGVAVAANSTITGSGPVIADGVATSTVTITLKDTNNNLVSGQTPTFSATDTGTNNISTACSVTNASGISTCTLASSTAETKTLSIASPVSKADGTVIFTAGVAVALNSTITGLSPVVANGVDTSAVTITLKDANLNPVSGQTPTFLATDTGTNNIYGTCSVTNASGISTCTLSSLLAETKTLSIATPVSKAGGSVIFTAGGAVALNSTITGTSPVVANGTATSTVTITLKDANNNPVPLETPTFSATDSGTNNTYSACSVSNASGISTCTLSSLTAESKLLSIATPVVKADGSVVFAPGAAVAINSTIIGTSPVVANGVATSTVTITLKDANNNLVSGQTPTFSATDTGTNNVYTACSVTNASGISTCTLSSLTAESKVLSIATPVSKADGSVVFTSGAAVALNSTITGTSPVVANGNATSTVTITLKDAANNPVPAQTPTFSATDTGTNNIYSACSATNASGVSTCTLTSLTAETKTLSIATPVIKADGTVVFSAGVAVAANSTITGTSPVTANGAATSTVTITLKDANNNPVAAQTPTFSATDTGTTNIYTACSATNALGVSTCTLASSTAETKTLSIATPVIKADGTVVFAAGVAAAANSTITGSSPVVANGVATSSVTVTLKDASNNPVSGQTPTFSATDTGTNNIYTACSATNASGVSTCTLASLTAEVKTLSIATPVIKADGTVTFTSGAAVAANSTITGVTSIVANGTATSTVTITLKDAANNPVPSQVPTFSATNTGATNIYGICSAGNASGVSTCTLASTKAESKTLSIATPVSKADGLVVFIPGSPSATTSTILGTTPVSADGVSTSAISITFLDDFSNPISGVNPIFNATDSGSSNSYGACSASNASGLSVCTLASTTAEVKTLQLTSPIAVTGNTVTFTSTSAVAANSTITGSGPVVANGTSTSSVTITLKDAFNNPVAGQTPTFSATNSGTTNTYNSCSVSSASGISTCTMTSLKAETKTLSLVTPVIKADGTVVFSADAAVALNSTITGSGPVIANGVATSTVTITLKDVNNNLVSGQTPTFTATDTGTNNIYTACSVSSVLGVSTCTLASATAETKTLSIATPVSKADGTVIFTAGVAVALNSTITGSSPVVANGSSTSTVTITLKDASLNPVAGQTPTFLATDSDANNSYGTCSATNASGISTCTLSSLKAESKTLTIATPVSKSDGSVLFTADSAVALNSTITGSGPVTANGVATSTITITLKDSSNNPVAGQTPTFSATDAGPSNTYGSCSVTDASGVSTCTLSSLKAETKILSIATPVVKADGTVVFNPDVAVAVNSTITGTGPVVANGAATSTVTITLKDANNNLVPGQTPTFSATDTGTNNVYTTCSVSSASGISTCTLASSTAEMKTLSIATPVSKADGTVIFTAGVPVAANSTIIGISPVVADGASTSSVTITLKDVNNNPVAGQTPTFSATNSGTNNSYGTCSVSNVSGVSTCTLSSATAETKTLSIVTPVAKTDGTVIFTAGSAVALNSTITGSGPVIANGTASSTVTITLKDATSNPVSGVTPTFSATNTGNTNVYTACSVSSILGVSTCTLTSLTAETKTLSITGPFTKADGAVTFTAGAAVAVNSTITGSGPVIANGAASSTITIALRDINNNLVSGVTPTFSATDTSTTNTYTACSVTNASGVSNCTMQSGVAETKTLSILTPVSKAGGTVVFTAGAADPANSNIIGTGPVLADGVDSSIVIITLRDALNNPISGQTPTFTATNSGSSNTYGACSASDASGASNCTLKSTTAELKTLSIATPISKADGTVLFNVGAVSVANSSISGTGPVAADGISTSTITITLKDAGNNPVQGLTPTFAATNTGTTNAYGACSLTDAFGISTCTMTSTKVETKTLNIATPVNRSGGTVVFTVGAPASATSTITGTSSIIANGVATSTVTVTLLDAFQNPVAGQTPTFSATNTGTTNTYGACSLTDAFGVSTCTLKSTKAESKILSIATPVSKADGSVIFIADAAVPLNSNISGSGPTPSDGASTSTITITLRDAFSNPVTGQTPTFSATDTNTTNAYGACSLTDASGVSTCTMTSLKSETKTLSIATPVSKADGSVVFIAGGAVAANSTITGSGPVIANGTATSTVTITLRDVSNNPVAGYTPTFGATNTGTTNIYGSCSVTDASGISTCTLASTKAEIKALAIATPIVKTDGTVTFTAGAAVAANSLISGTSSILANGVATSTVTITLMDVNSNPVAGQVPTFNATNTGTTNIYGVCSPSNTSGISTCTLASTKAEVKTFAITAPVAKTGTTAIFIAGAADATNSDISGTTPVSADGVAVSFITIAINDAFLNPIAGIVPIFNATNTGTTNVYGSCTLSDASGVSMCTLASNTAEFKTLQLTSPTAVTGSTTVEFSATLPTSANSTIAGTSTVTADGVDTSIITITLKDGSNNAVPGIEPQFDATDTGGTNIYDACSMSDASGVSVCTLASTKAESKILRITNPVLKSGGTVIFTAGLPAIANSSISGTGPVVANGTATSTVTINLKDFYNNPVSGSTPTFSATNTGTTNIYSLCSSTDASGNSTCTLKSTKAESKIPQILTPVVKSGSGISFVAGIATATNSTIEGTTPVNPDGTSTSEITITLKDAFSNTVSGVVPTFSATGSNNTYGVCELSDATGVSLCTLASTTAETKTISIATPVIKAGGTVLFQTGSPVAANSTITGTTSITADGVATSTITITLKDNTNTPVLGLTPVFVASGTGNTYSACSATNVSGISTCTLKSTKAEVKTLEITSPVLKNDGTVTFIPGAASLATSSIVANAPAMANGVDVCSVTVTIKDAQSNAISGVVPTFNLSGTLNTLIPCSTTDSAGISNCGVTSTKAEAKSVQLLTPLAIAGNTLDFNPNGIDIQIPIEMVDRGLSSSRTAIITFSRSRTSLDTNDYVAQTNTYMFEIIADNTNSTTSYTVSLVNNAGTAIANSAIVIPPLTTMKRFNVIWTPTTGADNYRIRTPITSANNAVKIHSAKMIVEQTAATATKIYIPLAGGDAIGEVSSDTTGAAISTATGTAGATFSQPIASNYYPWLRTDSSYDAIASGNAWTLETITGTSNVLNTASAALFNKINNQQITGALTTTTTKTTPTFNQVSFASTATNFNDGHTVELRIKSSNSAYSSYLYKAGLWLKLKFLKKTEIPFRLANRRSVAGNAPLADGRFLWDAGAWSNPAVFFKVAAIRPSGSSTITLQDHANSDTGTTTPTTPLVVAGSTVTPATTYGTQTVGPLTLTNMNRYFIQHNATASTQILGGAFVIIQAHD